jgi:hypothetical protein
MLLLLIVRTRGRRFDSPNRVFGLKLRRKALAYTLSPHYLLWVIAT